MEERAALLRRKISLLRGYLRDGVEAELAVSHLYDIAAAENELRRIGKDEERRR